MPTSYAVSGAGDAQYVSVSTEATTNLDAVTLLYPLAQVAALPDPGFELCATLPPGDPRCRDAWTARFDQLLDDCSKGGGPHCIDTTVSRTGLASGRISFLDGSGDGYFYSRRFEAVPGTRVSAEAWIKTAVTSPPDPEHGARTRLIFSKYGKYVPTTDTPWAPWLSGTGAGPMPRRRRRLGPSPWPAAARPAARAEESPTGAVLSVAQRNVV